MWTFFALSFFALCSAWLARARNRFSRASVLAPSFSRLQVIRDHSILRRFGSLVTRYAREALGTHRCPRPVPPRRLQPCKRQAPHRSFHSAIRGRRGFT